MKKFVYNLSTEPYALIKTNLVDNLTTVSENLQYAATQIVARLCEDGKQRAVILNASAPSSNAQKSIADEKHEGYAGSISLTGPGAVYDEFGTGEKGNADPHPLKDFYGLNPYNSGPMVSTHINVNGLHYWFAPHNSPQLMYPNGYTEGIPSGKQMYNTLQYVREIKRDVIKEQINDSMNILK